MTMQRICALTLLSLAAALAAAPAPQPGFIEESMNVR